MAALHSVAPADLGLGGEPVVDPVAEVHRWCDTLQTVDAALVPDWQDVRDALLHCAPTALAQRGTRRLPAGQSAGGRRRHQRGNRLGDLVDRRPRIDAGWFLINCDPDTYRRVPASAGIAPPTAELAEIYVRDGRLGRRLGLVHRVGVLQVGGDVVADRQAQPPKTFAASRLGGHGAYAAEVAGTRPVNGRLATPLVAARQRDFHKPFRHRSRLDAGPPSSDGSTNSAGVCVSIWSMIGGPGVNGSASASAMPALIATAMTVTAPVSSIGANLRRIHDHPLCPTARTITVTILAVSWFPAIPHCLSHSDYERATTLLGWTRKSLKMTRTVRTVSQVRRIAVVVALRLLPSASYCR